MRRPASQPYDQSREIQHDGDDDHDRSDQMCQREPRRSTARAVGRSSRAEQVACEAVHMPEVAVGLTERRQRVGAADAERTDDRGDRPDGKGEQTGARCCDDSRQAAS